MKPDTEKLLDRANHAIRAAELLLAGGESGFAVGRADYAMFYTAEALLNERGLEFAKHSGVHAAYGLHFAKPGVLDPKFHGWMLTAFNRRVIGDYDIATEVEPEEVQLTIERAREFLETARRYLQGL